MNTLSLCLIVGKNETQELTKCLKSVQGELFNEIIVITTQKDPEVEEVVNQYATATGHFKWIQDFSAARNYCFDQATSDYIMWLDADDEVLPENYQKLLELKKTLHKYDHVIMTYNYAYNEEGDPISVLDRERIVSNVKSHRWADPVHETISLPSSDKSLERRDIKIEHRRVREYDASRNLEILKSLYDSGNMSSRLTFYYAKDMYGAGRVEEAVPIFKKYLGMPTDFIQNKALACLRLFNYYANIKDTDSSVKYLKEMIEWCPAYAEPYYHLGKIEAGKSNLDEAIRYCELALTKSPAGLFGALTIFYKKLPLSLITQMHYQARRFDKALETVDKALALFPNDEVLLRNQGILKKDVQKYMKADPQDIKVAWLEEGADLDNPSQRIRRYNVHQALRKEGINSNWVTVGHQSYPQMLLGAVSGCNTVVISTFGQYWLDRIRKIREKGIKVLIDISEDILEDPFVCRILNEVDGVVACSKVLLEKVKPHMRSGIVIEDAVEAAEGEYDYFQKRDKPIALYIGMGGNSFLATDYLKETIEDAGFELRTCTEWDDANYKWSREGWPTIMRKAQVILCPQRVDVQPAKSNIKAAQAMHLGIPVVASNLPAYEDFIVNGKNGYICKDLKDWSNALGELRSVEKRVQIGLNGKDSVEDFKIETIADKWVDALCKIIPKASASPLRAVKAVKGKVAVPIIIPVYQGLAYLKMCISSIHRNTLYPYHIILSDAGSDKETWNYLNTLKGITVLSSDKRLNFSEAVNIGVKASGNSRFFAVLNSDVLVSKGWLTNLVRRMETADRLAACGVLSNCDSGWLYNSPDKESIDIGSLRPGMVIDEIKPRLDDLEKFMADSNALRDGVFKEQEWVAYYATIYARSAWEDVGDLDPTYKNGCEDLDHCRRTRNIGYNIGQAYDSFVFHFGGISRGAYQEEDKTKYNEQDKYNHEIYAKKWAKKEIIVYSGPAWEKWNREDVDSGMAGSETWAAELCSEFSKMGFKVTLFGNPKKEGVDRDGVQYLPYTKLVEYMKHRTAEMCILSRTCEPVKKFKLRSKRVHVMIHDIWVSQDKNYDMSPWAITSYGVLSKWHEDFVREHHSLPMEKMFLTHNGVRQELYQGREIVKKNKMVYSSSPDRGLETLLNLLPAIRKEVPDFELDVAYGFLNWEAAATSRKDTVVLAKIAKLRELMKRPGVNYLGRISKKELAERQLESKVWAFPTWFTETFCITAVENGLAGNAIVTTPLGGLLTTLEGTDSFVHGPGDPTRLASTKAFQDKFVTKVVNLLKNEELREKNAKEIYEKVKGYTWEAAAKQWLNL